THPARRGAFCRLVLVEVQILAHVFISSGNSLADWIRARIKPNSSCRRYHVKSLKHNVLHNNSRLETSLDSRLAVQSLRARNSFFVEALEAAGEAL
ncbi:MAG: hypothetical protein WCB14_01995, partial [Candidatus Acidiferrales bacterium]